MNENWKEKIVKGAIIGASTLAGVLLSMFIGMKDGPEEEFIESTFEEVPAEEKESEPEA